MRGKMREKQPLSYDSSSKHPRYHFNDSPFKGQWFWWLMIIYAVFYILIVLPIAIIENKLRYIYEKIT
jgi:hypothetical protein